MIESQEDRLRPGGREGLSKKGIATWRPGSRALQTKEIASAKALRWPQSFTCPLGRKKALWLKQHNMQEEVCRRPGEGGGQGPAQAEPGQKFGFYSKCVRSYQQMLIGE